MSTTETQAVPAGAWAVDKGPLGPLAGGIGAAQDGGTGQVTFYVEVDDPARYLARAEGLGGKTIVPPTEIEQFGPFQTGPKAGSAS